MMVTKEMLEAANRFWDMAESRIIGVQIRSEYFEDFSAIREFDDTFSFECFMEELFSNGEYEPTDDEIYNAIKDVCEERR